jgi:protocatechuate 3,4-dioxygenase, beta subunit
MTRRTHLQSAAAILLATRLPASFAQARRKPTPSQTEGPYYPVSEPPDADFDLLKNGPRTYSKGRAAWVEGVVMDTLGKPLNGGQVEIWQCDEDGHYDHPRDGSRIDPGFQGFGRVALTAAGEFRFRTIKPSPYVGRTPHIHVKIKLAGRELLTTQLYVEGEPGNERDGIWARLSREDRAAVTSPYVAGSDGLLASYTLVVRV